MTLWIPSTATRDKAEPTLLCRLCGKRWPKRQRREWMHHVGKCAKRNMDKFEKYEALTQSNAFTGMLDPEHATYNRKQSRAQRRERRKRGA